MTCVVDPDEPQRPRPRWLRVVPDDEPPPGAAPATEPAVEPAAQPPDTAPPGAARDSGPGREPGTWARPAARQSWSTAATAPALPRTDPAEPARPAPDPTVRRTDPTVRRTDPAKAPRPAPHSTADPAAQQNDPVVERAGRAEERVPVGRAVLTVAAVVAIGTAGALAADRLVGRPGDGHPPLYLLVALALPFWDALPARLGPRIAVVAAVTAAVAAAWYGLSLLHDPAWWRAEVSFGLACLGVGLGHLLVGAAARRRRTVAA